MATQTEKLIQALAIEVAGLKRQAANLDALTDPLRGFFQDVAAIKSLLVPLENLNERVARLEAQVAELTKARDTWGQRAWLVVIALIGAVVSIGSILLGASLNARRQP